MRRSASRSKRKRRRKPSFPLPLPTHSSSTPAFGAPLQQEGAPGRNKDGAGAVGRLRKWKHRALPGVFICRNGRRTCHTRYATRSFPCNAAAAQYAHAARPWEGTGPAFPPWARPTSHRRGCHAQSSDAAVLPAAVRAVRRFRAVALRRRRQRGRVDRWSTIARSAGFSGAGRKSVD